MRVIRKRPVAAKLIFRYSSARWAKSIVLSNIFFLSFAVDIESRCE